MSEHHTDRGTTHISARALNRVLAAVAAKSLDVAPDQVGVNFSLPDDLLELTVSTPIPAAAIVGRVQEQIRQEAGALTGQAIGRVSVRQSSAPLTAALAGNILTRVRTKYRQDPVRLVGLAAAGLASVGVIVTAFARAITRK